ncbi:STAS domain-containing protein [Marinimicrobium sp. ABcell2]|uniref:STAS domain-containing protein n=1 Tax=Marinimicrobium sp. ABcell2 TaxID=3069751 RepID=UPI0027B05FE1|nr:STAS domain-containing protein [Marinimicrobium sp. ABcell2]MDQ2077920.1 STAS domain-containing protein [Marinimicrobium sp. ABcell2]
MRPGQILVADHQGVYVIKMVGDVRLTLCISFDQFIDAMFSQADFSGVLFDLTEAEAIDSTTLGLMAKIALQGREQRDVIPVVYSSNPSINRLLETMGFDEILKIVNDLEPPVSADTPLPDKAIEESRVKDKVLEAHKILMSLNENNRETFRNLVNMLEKT